ncbi:MAG: flagellar hook capping FlgD N-terminal domain-containing protein [Phycisphaerae bacterium]
MPVASGVTPSASDLQVQFLNLLVAQLQNQNPLEPMDNSDMTAQLAQISSLQQMEEMNGYLETVAGEDSPFAAALVAAEGRYATSLIGKEISVLADDGTVLSGTVTGVERLDGEFVLQVGDQRVPLDAVREIRE